MKKLDFIMVGTMKSGTSSLAFQLAQNPDICIPLDEMHYFNNEENYEKGEKWYASNFKECSNKSIIGEKTPTYSYLDKVPYRIFEYNPDIKLIWLFRNPVDRSYSNYWHAVRLGSEKYRFTKAIKHESKRVKENVFKGYLKRSKYIEQVERYLQFFDKKKMHFILFEDFVKNPIQIITDVFKFLNVPFNNFVYQNEIRNVALIPRAPRFLRKSREILGETALSYRVIRRLSFRGRKPGYRKLSPKVRAELNEYFEEYNKKLENLTGLDVSVWKKK
ncbi:MAG: sulfotransferase family protein [Candidatus Heimdallarchaeaceae archaeon]